MSMLATASARKGNGVAPHSHPRRGASAFGNLQHGFAARRAARTKGWRFIAHRLDRLEQKRVERSCLVGTEPKLVRGLHVAVAYGNPASGRIFLSTAARQEAKTRISHAPATRMLACNANAVPQ